MVLQSGHATIWGFTEGNQNAITANIGCIMKDGVEYQESQTLTPEKVMSFVTLQICTHFQWLYF